jgi:hypothetical protein
MGILAYKPQFGDIWKLFGEGEICASEGVYKDLGGGKAALFVLLDKQPISGRDSSKKDDNGKASQIPLEFPLKARFELDLATDLGRALTNVFTKIQPDLAAGFAGDLNLAQSRSAIRIAMDNLENRDFDLAGGLCFVKAKECATQFAVASGGGGKGGAPYKAAAETIDERAALVISMLADYDKPVGKAFLALIDYADMHKLGTPNPLDFARYLTEGTR